jgi:tRNA 5-methylaminomethyl-2-thiouridine biosynthesis bifunctional protein
LPLIGNRGQVDIYAGSAATGVRTILCGQGYLTPVTDGLQSLGGSYYVERTSTEQNRQTHLTLLSRMDPQLADDMAQRRPLQQRVGQRCQTPDRMPLAGLVSPQYPGLYINAAHGSNGLARTPVSAALLASVMNGTPSPLDDAMCKLVNPGRFGQAE